MSNPINLYSNSNHYIVKWNAQLVNQIVEKLDILKLLYQNIKATQIGLVVELSTNEHDVLWVNSLDMLRDAHGNYRNYLKDMYRIHGVVFVNNQDATKFKDLIEKKLVWEMLLD